MRRQPAHVEEAQRHRRKMKDAKDMANPNPVNKFQKGNKQASKKLGQPNLMTREQHQVGVELGVELGVEPTTYTGQ
jgi:hypothetical protein